MAGIVDIDLDPFRQRLVLDAGSDAGVQAGPGADRFRRRARPGGGSAARIARPRCWSPMPTMRCRCRSRAPACARSPTAPGRTDQLVLPNIPQSADVRRGDVLITSGIGGRFPGRLPGRHHHRGARRQAAPVRHRRREAGGAPGTRQRSAADQQPAAGAGHRPARAGAESGAAGRAGRQRDDTPKRTAASVPPHRRGQPAARRPRPPKASGDDPHAHALARLRQLLPRAAVRDPALAGRGPARASLPAGDAARSTG